MNVVQIMFSIGDASDHMKNSLNDFVWSLEINLKKIDVKSKVVAEFKKGIFKVLVFNHTVETLKPYIDAFSKSMRRSKESFFINIDTLEISDLNTEIANMRPSGEIFPADDMARIQFKKKMAKSTSELKSLLSNKKTPKKDKKK